MYVLSRRIYNTRGTCETGHCVFIGICIVTLVPLLRPQRICVGFPILKCMMPLLSEDPLRIALGMLMISGLVSTLNCPQNHYPYSCSTCFTIATNELDFNSSNAHCQNRSGILITVDNSTQMLTLGRYLEGLNDSRKLWIGYRYTSSGRVIDMAGQPAPDVLQDSRNFAGGAVAGDANTCIGVQEGKFFRAPCTEGFPFICSYTYSVPTLVGSSQGVVHVAQSESVSLRAQFHGVGISGMEWRHNGEQILPQNEIGITTAGSFTQATFTIQQFSSSTHSGRYEFTVENPSGTTILAVWEIQRAVVGSFVAMPENLEIPEGQVALFRCSTEGGLPRPQITWFKDSAALNTTGARFYVSDVTGTLFIREVLEQDAGLYHCTATNAAGSNTSAPATLNVTTPPQSNTQARSPVPEILLQPGDMTVLRGDPYSLECVGLPSGTDSETTFLNDSNIGQGVLHCFNYPGHSGFPVFRIESVSFNDQSSYYACQIYDVATRSSIRTREATLTVHSKARVDDLFTVIKGVRSDDSFQSVPLGSNLTLQCQFSGVPIPGTVTWTVDSRITTDGVDTTNSNESTLELTNFQRPGIYQCHVTNPYGTASSGVALCGTDTGRVPGPVSFRAESDTNTSIYVEWTTPGNPNTHPLLLQYHVFLVDSSFRGVESFGPFPVYWTHYVITGLEPGVEYSVAVVASSVDGRGELPLANATVTTFAPPSPVPLSNITVERTSDNSILVLTWPASPLPSIPVGTVIGGYEIQYRNTDDSNVTTVFVGVGRRQLAVQGLSNAASYEVRIHVVFQTQRDPLMYEPGPWSEWQLVQGITTPPPNVTLPPSHPPSGGIDEGTRGTATLLVIVLIPIAILLIVIITTVTVIVALWSWKKHRQQACYSPAKEENSIQPMGSQVFNLPFGSHQVIDARPFSHDQQVPDTTFPEPTFDTFLDNSSQHQMAARSKEGLNSSFPNTIE